LSKGADKIFSSVSITGFMLLINGLLLWSTRRIKKEGAADFSIKKALLIGIVQGLAVIPGISRSGSTIATAIFLGLNKEMAVRYSFLLSIPAIIGAEILVLKDLSDPMISFSATLMGTVSAFIIGYFSLKLLLYIVKKRQLHFFAPYCWIIGLVALFWGWQTP
jgi:undecaprenyl-diphosphatase